MVKGIHPLGGITNSDECYAAVHYDMLVRDGRRKEKQHTDNHYRKGTGMGKSIRREMSIGD